MMLVIRPRGGGSCDSGLGRYSGWGMLDAVGRRLFSSGFKRAISSGVNSALAHKVVDAVVNGATSTSQKVGKAVESVVNNAIDSTKKLIVGKKRSSIADPIIVPQKIKLDIDSLID